MERDARHYLQGLREVLETVEEIAAKVERSSRQAAPEDPRGGPIRSFYPVPRRGPNTAVRKEMLETGLVSGPSGALALS